MPRASWLAGDCTQACCHLPSAAGASLGRVAATSFHLYEPKELMQMMPRSVLQVLSKYPEHMKRMIEGVEYMNTANLTQEQEAGMREQMRAGMMALAAKVNKDPGFLHQIDSELQRLGKPLRPNGAPDLLVPTVAEASVGGIAGGLAAAAATASASAVPTRAAAPRAARYRWREGRRYADAAGFL
eukprot:TRINITY_DN20446_c0_g1_i1.p3 TRINITY_DN20446_c0_g1~~TRINITY_DN20446_c0_g1_i1.p3  ORF type:complete len:185 (+),score=37.05 TRINITY_DN20446_c0_g1_i1:232-786(+)